MAVLSTVLGLVSGLVDVYIQRIDYASATVTYIGLAASGTTAAQAGWQIKRVTLDSSNRPILVEFAGGAANFNGIWDTRATLSYS